MSHHVLPRRLRYRVRLDAMEWVCGDKVRGHSIARKPAPVLAPLTNGHLDFRLLRSTIHKATIQKGSDNFRALSLDGVRCEVLGFAACRAWRGLRPAGFAPLAGSQLLAHDCQHGRDHRSPDEIGTVVRHEEHRIARTTPEARLLDGTGFPRIDAWLQRFPFILLRIHDLDPTFSQCLGQQIGIGKGCLHMASISARRPGASEEIPVRAAAAAGGAADRAGPRSGADAVPGTGQCRRRNSRGWSLPCSRRPQNPISRSWIGCRCRPCCDIGAKSLREPNRARAHRAAS